LKKRYWEILYLAFGVLLMGMGIGVLIWSFYLLVALQASPDSNKVVAGYIVPIFLIVIGYSVLRGKDIGFPPIKPM
jgi:hypothetical protein